MTPSSVASALALTLLVCSVAGCDSSSDEALQLRVVVLQRQIKDARAKQEATRQRLENVRSKLSDIEGRVGDLKSAVDDLTSAVADFGEMDWRKVAREVESATSDVETALNSLEPLIEDAARAADERN